MKTAVCFAAISALALLWFVVGSAAELKKKPAVKRVVRRVAVPTPTKLSTTRMLLIDRMKASQQQLQDAVPHYEEMLAQQSAEFEVSQRLFNQAVISRAELDNRERAMINTRLELQRMREWIAEDELSLALAENAQREKFAQGSQLNLGEYFESANLIRYEGHSDWSLAGLGKITKFFRARFGRDLPISALGQSATHDRMGLDHRGAVDIALQPDSEEGHALLTFLRTNGIPFMAFRGRVLDMATGAHIHVGKPSPRLIEVKQSPGAPEKNAVRG